MSPKSSVHQVAKSVSHALMSDKHTNSRIFYVMDDVWAELGVVDVSAELRAVAVEFDFGRNSFSATSLT